MVLEFLRKISSFRTLVLGAPGGAVEGFPFPFEGIRIAGARPELGLFQEDMVHARIDHGLDMLFLEILQIILGGNNVGNEFAMPDGVSIGLHLPFVQVPPAIPLSREIVLVGTPGDTGHVMGLVPPLPPTLKAFLQAFRRNGSVNDGYVGPVIQGRTPLHAGLESGFHTVMSGTGTSGYGKQ